MDSKFCNRCGGKNLIADRALAGRLVCRDCGTPQSNRSIQMKYQVRNKFNLRSNRLLIISLIFLLSLIIVLTS